MDLIYDLRDVTRTFGSGGALVTALHGVDLRIRAGELVVVAGPSGSGKSTLLQLLGALDRPTSGEVLFEGVGLDTMGDGALTRLRRETIGFVFQGFGLVPTLSAAQNVEAAMAPTRRGGPQRRARTRELLERVGLGHRLHNLPTQLSGGEQQRVAIARALANGPRVLLADEPTGNLDSATGEEIVGLLHRLNADGLTVVLITHDQAIAGSARRLVRLRDGRLVGPPDDRPLVAAGPAAGGGAR